MGRALRRREEPLADLGVRIHRAAHVEEQEDAQVRAALRAQLQRQLAGVARGLIDGALEVQLVERALAHEGAQAAQRHLDVPRVEGDVGAQVPEAPLARDFESAAATRRVADLDAGRVGTARAVRRGAPGAGPFVAAVVAPALLGQPLPHLLADLVEVHPLQKLLFLLGQLPLRRRVLEPAHQLLGERDGFVGHAVEVVGEGAVEAVEVLLAVHAEGAGHLVEAVERPPVQPQPERLRQRDRLMKTDLHAPLAQLVEELDEHQRRLLVI